VSDAERDLKQELRLRPERPPVTRLSRTVLMSLATLAALTVSGALIWALFQNGAHSKAAEELHTTDSKQPPDELAALPRDYAVVKPAPQLGHPILADLAPPTVSAQANEPAAPPDDHLAQEDEAARTSHLFFSSTTGSEQPTAVKAPAATSEEGSATAVGGTDPVDPVASQNMQKQKLAFLAAPTDHTTVSPDRLENPASRYVVQAGSVIPAALITGIRSDLPGQVTGQVTEHVYDSPTGRYLLIPQGSKLIGLYDSQVALGQNRVLLVWTSTGARSYWSGKQERMLKALPGCRTKSTITGGSCLRVRLYRRCWVSDRNLARRIIMMPSRKPSDRGAAIRRAKLVSNWLVGT
jgi:type IV secretion system protein TrbI